MEVILYHYHPKTNIFTGTTNARVSPLDKKQGRIIFLKPPNTTEISPPVNRPPTNGFFEMFFSNEEQKWKFRNTQQGKNVADKQNIVKSFIEYGHYILVTSFPAVEGGNWYILYYQVGDPPYYTFVHDYDEKWGEEKEATIEEIRNEIDIIEGRIDPGKTLDTPVTEEEKKQSLEYWESFKKTSLESLEVVIKENEEKFFSELDSAVEEEKKTIEKYKSNMNEIIANERNNYLAMLSRKKEVVLQLARSKIAKVLQLALENKK